MKILLITQVLPYPPDSGPKVKTWNVLKYISCDHDVTLVSFIRGDQSAEIKELESHCSGGVYAIHMKRNLGTELLAFLRSYRTKNPWLIERDYSRNMQDLLNRLCHHNSFDIVHVDQLNMAQFVCNINKSIRILDAHNALWILYKRLWKTMRFGPQKWVLGRDWQLMKKYEAKMVSKFDEVVTVSQEDKSALEQIIDSSRNIYVIPISIDTEENQIIPRNPENNHIVHIGTMYWPPNIDGVRWFINHVYPKIQKKRPDVIFDIIGSRPPRDIEKLNIQHYGINVTGYVENPQKYLEGAAVMVVPLRAGGGMRVKILNALSQGIPIVTTSLGCEGIEVIPNQHLLIADSPDEFASATLSLLNDPNLALRLGRNGRKMVVQRYDYRLVCRSFDEIYNTNRFRN